MSSSGKQSNSFSRHRSDDRFERFGFAQGRIEPHSAAASAFAETSVLRGVPLLAV